MEENVSQIHKAKLAVMARISQLGIAKLSRNTQQGYNFRGIEAAMNTLSPILVANSIAVSSRYSDLTLTEREKVDKEGKKGVTRFVVLKGAFTFSAEDGSSFTEEVYGEAMDSGDKAVVKAQSVAFRTALFQAFVVPTMAMDPEEHDEPGEESEGGEVDAWREAAMQGSESLREYFKAHKPSDAFWKRNSASLKAAAAAADAEAKKAPQ